MNIFEKRFTLVPEEEVCQTIEAFLSRTFGKDVTIENIVRRTCLVSFRDKNKTRILITKIQGFDVFDDKETFQVFLKLDTGAEIQLAVTKVVSLPISFFIDGVDMLEYSQAEHEGWIGGKMKTSPNIKKERKKFFAFLRPFPSISVRLPLDVKVKIL